MKNEIIKLPIACLALYNEQVPNIFTKKSLNSCLDACNLSAKCMMKFLTISERMRSPSKFKVYFKNDCGEGRTYYPTVSSCNYHVTVQLHIADDDALLNIFSVAINGEIDFGRVLVYTYS